MKFFSHKKGIGWSAVMYLILGLVVIGVVVTGVIGPGVGFAKKKFFDEESSEWAFPWRKQEEFEPYVPEEHFDEDDAIVSDSMKALHCALNSVAIGRFDYDDKTVCSSGYEKVSEEQTGIKSVFSKLVNREGMKSINYGKSQVSCSGASSKFLTGFKSKTYQETREIIGNAVKDCYVNTGKVDLPNEYTLCASFDTSELIFKKMLTKTNLKKYLNDKGNEENDVDWKNAADALKTVKIEEMNDGEACIYYNKNIGGREGIISDNIIIQNCLENNKLVDSFFCSVNSFELPQDVSNSKWKPFLQAFGDPKYLVYYEKFPKEAAAYWHKEWSDMFNVYTIGFVAVSGVLNVVGAGKAGKLGKEVIEAAAEGTIKRAIKKTTEKAILKEGSEYLLERASKTSLKNLLRTLAVEQESKTIYGVGKKSSQQIGELLAERLGSKSGSRAFNEKIEKEIKEDIFDILTTNKVPRPPGVVDAGIKEEVYRRGLANTIVEGGPITYLNKDGIFVVSDSIKGVKNIFKNKLTPKVTDQILKKQTYRQFFQQMVGEGTEDLSKELLEEAAENSLKRLIALNLVDKNLVDVSFGEGLKQMGLVFAKGTVGYEKKSGILSTVYDLARKQIPIEVPSMGWALTGPVGYIGATIGKTTFVGIPKWVKNHQIPLVLLISVYIESLDSQNEKYIPVGVNDIALTRPTLLGGKKTYKLNEETIKYFIRNKKKPNNVLYLASPCKANLNIVKKDCECINDPDSAIFDFGGGLMNVERGTIIFREDNDIIELYRKQYKELDDYIIGEKGYTDEDVYINAMLEVRSDETYFENNILKAPAKLNFWTRDDKDEILEDRRKAMKHLEEFIDIDNAVKMCEEKGLYLSNRDILHEVDCIEVEIERSDGYCYDHFPKTEIIRTSLLGVDIAINTVIMGASFGTLTIPSLIFTGVLFSATDVILENFEKWP